MTLDAGCGMTLVVYDVLNETVYVQTMDGKWHEVGSEYRYNGVFSDEYAVPTHVRRIKKYDVVAKVVVKKPKASIVTAYTSPVTTGSLTSQFLDEEWCKHADVLRRLYETGHGSTHGVFVPGNEPRLTVNPKGTCPVCQSKVIADERIDDNLFLPIGAPLQKKVIGWYCVNTGCNLMFRLCPQPFWVNGT